MENFWSIIWVVVWSFVFVAYLFVLFYILTDLFRDRELSGWWKALWIIFLIFMPVPDGAGLHHRPRQRHGGAAGRRVQQARSAQDAYIKQVPDLRRQVAGRPHRRREGAAGQRHHQPGRVRQLKAKALA